MAYLNTSRLISCLLFFFSVFIAASGAYAKGPYIGNLTVINSPKGLLVNATLINGFTRKVLEAIQSGVPITLQYDIELKERKTIMPDENIVKRVIKKIVTYDSLKKEYQFSNIYGTKNETISLKRAKDVRNKMIQLRNIYVISTEYLKPNEEYYIRIKARVSSKGFWFPFNYILFFMDFLNFETSWEESTTIVINQFPVIQKND